MMTEKFLKPKGLLSAILPTTIAWNCENDKDKPSDTIPPGEVTAVKVYEVYSSAYRDTIIVNGFPDTNEHIVNLYAIDLSKNLSEPLTPPVDLIRNWQYLLDGIDYDIDPDKPIAPIVISDLWHGKAVGPGCVSISFLTNCSFLVSMLIS